MSPFLLLAASAALSMLFIPLAGKLAPAMGMIDQPDPRKVHVTPVPRVGGFGIVLGAVVPLAFVLTLEPLMQSFVIGALALFVYGMWDDARQLSHWAKFVGQFFAAGLVVYYGDLWVERIPFAGATLLPPEIGKPFTVIAIVGVINALNHSDGLDGLAGGESILSLIVITFLAYLAGDELAVYVACATIGGILGFLRFNTHPARVFMGDSGSQFLGFTLAFLAVYLTQVCHPALSPALPLLILGLPIADINAVLYMRIKGGMNWFKATRNHVHHRLLDLGFDHHETVVLIYSFQALMVVCAVLFRYESDLLVTALYFGLIIALYTALTLAERRGWRAHALGSEAGLSRLLGRIKDTRALARLPRRAVAALIAVIFLGGAATVAEVPTEFIYIAIALPIILLIVLAFGRPNVTELVERAIIYATAMLVVYLLLTYPPASPLIANVLSTPLFIALAVIVGIAIRFSTEIAFKTTPTDYLIVFGIVALAVLGRETLRTREIYLLAIHSIILLYACELLIGRQWRRSNPMTVTTLATLGIVALNAFFSEA